MARRRAEGTSFTFDLEPDDGEELFTELPVEPSRFARVAGAARARVRAWPRRRVVAVGTAVAVVVAGGLGAAALTMQAQHRSWVQVAQTAPGAVVDLGHAPVEAWRVELEFPTPVGLVGETLVVRGRMWGSSGGVGPLHGVDLAAGRLLWTTPAPEYAECSVGGASLWIAATQRVERGDVVVCLASDRRSVTVVDAAGQVLASRDLAGGYWDDPAQASAVDPLDPYASYGEHRVLVTRDGGLLRIDRIGAPLPPPSFSVPDGEDLTGGIPTMTLLTPLVTRDLRVRLEDAVTGETRWETIVDSVDLPAGAEVANGSPCMGWEANGGPAVAADQSWSDDVGPHTLATTMCGLDVTIDLATGEILEQQDVFEPDYQPWRASSTPLVDGGWGEIGFDADRDGQVQDVTTRIMRPDGSVVGVVPGVVFPPLATDGPASALLVAVSGTGTGVAAYEADDASLRWRDGSLASPRVLARTTQAVVVSDGAIVMALDRETGARLWKHALYGDTIVQPDGGYGIVDALTDGRYVSVVTPATQGSYTDPMTGDKTTTTLDLATGKVVWASTSDDPAPYPIAGRLYRFDHDGVVAFD
ncbi:hypothetical protein Xcel_2715 [Xylanimonas cellulosilytica DSM 15894]|uniref:Uncharacterized protein n=1 Tax=Xylanimonas cellulosilytica (strain DSM 15894 / JCM 12276 / CECT 5975 / KCTC 9989 / LMG 20990 / NBRC 107835 / XIL07) TaxID=446471 RepID=D1BXT8_XYLCX|nr:PQQ-binding-like beta-propeller repeat protein [Xylanimonas cellulosilytica]ACZ31729.1 hypothetical protein Xcel_2715 [Xylanimonas cellulosilytica DSM 15894]